MHRLWCSLFQAFLPLYRFTIEIPLRLHLPFADALSSHLFSFTIVVIIYLWLLQVDRIQDGLCHLAAYRTIFTVLDTPAGSPPYGALAVRLKVVSYQVSRNRPYRRCGHFLPLVHGSVSFPEILELDAIVLPYNRLPIAGDPMFFHSISTLRTKTSS